MSKYLVEGDFIMCIFCGGTCGGVGDAILSSSTLGISLLVLKIQAVRASRKQNIEEEVNKKEGEIAPDSLVN